MFTKTLATIHELTIYQNHPYQGLFQSSGRTEAIHLYFETKEQAEYYRDKYYPGRSADLKSHLAYKNDGQFVLLHNKVRAYPVLQPEKLANVNYLTLPAGWRVPNVDAYANEVQYQELLIPRESYAELINCPVNNMVGFVVDDSRYSTADVPYHPRGEYLLSLYTQVHVAKTISEAQFFICKDNAGEYATINSRGVSVSLIPAEECTPPHAQMLPLENIVKLPAQSGQLEKYYPTAAEYAQAVQLFKFVHKADYRSIEAMWQKNPRLMFVEIELEYGTRTTPLKKALYNLDKWTWKPFYEWIKQNRPELENEFLTQNAEQTQHIDQVYFQPLFEEYERYMRMSREYRCAGDPLSLSQCKTAVDHQWPRLAQMQRKILPWHFLREMCRSGRLSVGHSLGPDARFDHKTAPIDGRIWNGIDEYGVKLDSEYFERVFGTGGYHNYFLGLVRGKLLNASGGNSWSTGEYDQAGGDVAGDVEVIQQLLKVRTADLASIPAPALVLQQEAVVVPAEKEEMNSQNTMRLSK